MAISHFCEIQESLARNAGIRQVMHKAGTSAAVLCIVSYSQR
ncbi:MAG: hypothetical protein ACI9HK_000654 [Pirellulaceae bacterium]|jgi:hypothetical protein